MMGNVLASNRQSRLIIGSAISDLWRADRSSVGSGDQRAAADPPERHGIAITSSERLEQLKDA
jgi:hypothetical protein